MELTGGRARVLVVCTIIAGLSLLQRIDPLDIFYPMPSAVKDGSISYRWTNRVGSIMT